MKRLMIACMLIAATAWSCGEDDEDFTGVRYEVYDGDVVSAEPVDFGCFDLDEISNGSDNIERTGPDYVLDWSVEGEALTFTLREEQGSDQTTQTKDISDFVKGEGVTLSLNDEEVRVEIFGDNCD